MTTVQTGDSAQAARLMQELGDPEQIAAELEHTRASARAFSSDRPRMIEEHPGQWVAVYDSKCVARESFDGLLEAMDEQGIPREHAVVRFVDEDEQVFIL